MASRSLSLAALSLQTSCDAAADRLQCHLDSWLHILYLLCAVLGVVLVVVATFAIVVWLKNRNAPHHAARPRSKDLSA